MLSIGSIVWGVRDVPQAIEFWGNALDYRLRDEPDVDWAILEPKDGKGVQLALKLVDSSAPHRHHLDLYADDQAAEINRLIELGAFPVEEWVYEADADYIVLDDPDGNRFCVVQT